MIYPPIVIYLCAGTTCFLAVMSVILHIMASRTNELNPHRSDLYAALQRICATGAYIGGGASLIILMWLIFSFTELAKNTSFAL